jgi:hypothetical protein
MLDVARQQRPTPQSWHQPFPCVRPAKKDTEPGKSANHQYISVVIAVYQDIYVAILPDQAVIEIFSGTFVKH